MPEGHTIHREARVHASALGGKKTASSSPQGRFEAGASAIDGQELRRVEPLGKHFFYHFRAGVVHVHLGRYGGFRRIRRAGKAWPEPTPSVRWRLTSAKAHVGFDLSGPTACDLLTGEEAQSIRDRLGVDLLGPDAAERRDAVREKLLGKKTPLSVALMDQSVVSGIGNIFRIELLYRHRIHPRTPGRDVAPEAFDTLYADALALMRVGVRHRRIMTVEPAALGLRRWKQLGPDDRFWVYGRSHCRGCGGPVETFAQAGRKVHFCPAEQVG